MCLEKIRDGSALDKFRQNVELQKGNPRICERPETILEKNICQVPVTAETDGYVSEINTKAIGESVCALGGGRIQVKDAIDYAVGFACHKKLGDAVQRGEEIGVIFCRRESHADSISEKLRNAYKIATEKTRKSELVKEIIS